MSLASVFGRPADVSGADVGRRAGGDSTSSPNDLSAVFEIAAGMPFATKEQIGDGLQALSEAWPVVFATLVAVFYVAWHPRIGSLARGVRAQVLGSGWNGAQWYWTTVSTMVTVRSILIWLAHRNVVVRRAVEFAGLAMALDARRGRKRSGDKEKEKARRCHSDKYASMGQEPTTFPSGVTDVVQPADYERFKARVACLPGSLPTEETGEWQAVMERTDEATQCHYKAWRHILPYGGTEYLSRSVFENATAEEICDFYNSDITRDKWDALLLKQHPIEKDPRTGAEILFWERQLPVISNRDYVFSRRTWKDGDYYFTITRGMHHPKHPESSKVIRVDPYFSAWRMRTIPGKEPGTFAGECILLHFEEQKVQQDIARMAVRHGMWGVVRNLCRGFRDFQNERNQDEAMQDAGGVSTRRYVDLSKMPSGLKKRLKKAIGFAFPVLLGVLLAQQGTGNVFDVVTHARRGFIIVSHRRRALKAIKTVGVVAAAKVAERVAEDDAEDDSITLQHV
jgi:hypothetical protein